MQEEIERKTIAITVQAAKLSSRVLKAAILAAIRKIEQNCNTPKVGRNSMKRLAGRDGSANAIEVTGRIRSFERIAKKYQVRYHIKKDDSVTPPKWTVYFKANQADALRDAFAQYTRKDMEKNKKPSLLTQLRKNIEMVRNAVVDRIKNKEHGGPEL